MNAETLIKAVKDWGFDHEIDNPVRQMVKVQEEVGEIAHEISRSRFKSLELKDALGDTMVTLIILADICGYDIIDCLEQAYNEIKDRQCPPMPNAT